VEVISKVEHTAVRLRSIAWLDASRGFIECVMKSFFECGHGVPSSGDPLTLLPRERVVVVAKLLVKSRVTRIKHDPNPLAAAGERDTQNVITVAFGTLQIQNGGISVSGLEVLENRPLAYRRDSRGRPLRN
jgi:hypothetical protein